MEEPKYQQAEGQYGRFWGAQDDRVVFAQYRERGTWSPELVSLMTQRLLGEGGTLIDVGANIGLLCVPVVEASGAHCIALEPEPGNHTLLRRNVLEHGLERRIETLQLAAHSCNGQLPMSLSPDNFGDHRLDPQGADRDRHHTHVRAATLDSLLAERSLQRPLVLKLDTQGAELQALRGARQLLPMVDWLVIEYWPAGLARMGDRVQSLWKELLRMPLATVLSAEQEPRPLRPTREVLRSLSWIANDGSDTGFFDLLLGRRPLG